MTEVFCLELFLNLHICTCPVCGIALQADKVLQVLDWEDNRTAPIVMGNTNYTSCSLFCSSIPTQVRNAANQPACCDGIFIPSVREFFVKLRRPLLVRNSRFPHRLSRLTLYNLAGNEPKFGRF